MQGYFTTVQVGNSVGNALSGTARQVVQFDQTSMMLLGRKVCEGTLALSNLTEISD